MRVKLCGQEDTLEVEESLGRRLCEQGKAVPGDRGIVPQRESPGAGQTGAEQCGPDHTVDISGSTEKAARKRGKRNGAGGEDKDGQ